MANATANRDRYVIGKEGRDVHLPVAAGAHLYAQTMVVQVVAGGYAGLSPVGTAGSSVVVGVIQHEVDNTTGAAGIKRAAVECDREFVFDNDVTNPASEALFQGTALYAIDDHTVGTSSLTGTLRFAGTFHGMEPNGKVRVFISNANVTIAAALAS